MTEPRAFWLRHGLPGFVGTFFITIGALGVGWLPLTTPLIEAPFVDLLRSSSVGTLMSRSFVFVGAAVLLQAWLVLGYDLLTEHPVRRRWMAAVLGTWTIPLLFAPPIFSRDTYSYYEQGRLVGAGYDPYTQGVSVLPGWFMDGVDPMWGEAPTPYGPLFLMIERGVYWVTEGQPLYGALIFRLVALVGVGLMFVYLPRLAEAHGIDGNKALWIGVLNPLIVMHFLAAGHNDALMTGLLVAGFAYATQRRLLVANACIAFAASVKPIALLAVPFIGLMWAGTHARWGQRIVGWIKSGISVAVVFMVTALAAGVGLGWINALTTPGEVRTWLSPSTAAGMLTGGIAESLGLVENDDAFVAVFRLIGLIVGIAIVAYLILKPAGRSITRNAALAFAAVVICGPVLHPWYLLWFLPLFAATGLNSRELKATILITAAFTFHGMSESSATSDNIFEISDGVSIIAGIVIVAIALLASPRERQLVLGEPVSHGIIPDTDPDRARAKAAVFVGG